MKHLVRSYANNTLRNFVAIMIVLAALVIIGCSESEESATQLTLDGTYDEVRNGARLILKYNSQSKAFEGTVENTTNSTLKQVRVEVHLSNGTELGPTTPKDLAPDEKISIELSVPAANTNFDTWSAHAEVG